MNIRLPVSQEILKSVADLDRFRGTWPSRRALPAARLDRLREAARIQSVAASCRLSGVRMSDNEVAGLLADRSIRVRDAAVVLGYARAVDHPLPSQQTLLSTDDLRRLHAVLTTEQDPALPTTLSDWRTTPHQREAFDGDGHATGRVFGALPPHMIVDKLEGLVTWLEFELRARKRHPVLVVGAFAHGLLLVSPFAEANARLSRLMIVKLLERAGYDHMPFASVESVIEDERESYHEAFDRSQAHFWRGEADLEPWLTFFLGALTEHQRRVEAKLDLERGALDFPPLQQAILQTVREHGSVDAGLLLRATGANRNTLKDNLRRLVDRGALERTGERRGTRYRLGIVDAAK